MPSTCSMSQAGNCASSGAYSASLSGGVPFAQRTTSRAARLSLRSSLPATIVASGSVAGVASFLQHGTGQARHAHELAVDVMDQDLPHHRRAADVQWPRGTRDVRRLARTYVVRVDVEADDVLAFGATQSRRDAADGLREY